MKVSLWQQFSSNHSSSYTVVGVFNTTDEARQARDTLQQMILDIVNWKARPDITDVEYDMVEREYAQRYGVTWDDTIDWLGSIHSFQADFQQHVREHLTVFDRNVVVDSHGETWQEGEQFEKLMTAMGARTHTRIEYGGFRIRLTCTAPNHDVAQTIYRVFMQQWQLLKLDLFWIPVPWVVFHPHFERTLNSTTREQFHAAEQAWYTWYDIVRLHSGDDDEFLLRQIERHTQESRVLLQMAELYEDIGVWDASAIIEGHQIIIEETNGGTDLMRAIPSFHSWLLAQGCDIRYEFLPVDAS